MILSVLKQVRETVELLRLALLDPSPDGIFLAIPGLQQAEASLAELQAQLRQPAIEVDEVHIQLRGLKNDLRIAARLLRHGIAFCRGWANLCQPGSFDSQPGSAYTQAGAPAEVPLGASPGELPGGRIAVRG